MAIEKGLYAAPEGIEAEAVEESALEIEIVNPDAVTLDDGSMEITLIPGGDETDIIDFGDNIADAMEDSDLIA